MRAIPLKNIAKVFNGTTPSKEEQRSTGFPVLKIKDISEDGQFRRKFLSFVDKSYIKGIEEKVINIGDSLVLNAAHNADYVGSKQHFVRYSSYKSLATGEWLIIRPDVGKVEPNYLHFWLQLSHTKKQIRSLVKGIHLYPKDVENLFVNLPFEKNEQKRIAATLDKADRLRHQHRFAQTLADSFLQSIFINMFGDPTSNPKGWKKVKLNSLGELDRGHSKHRPRNAPHLYGGQYPFIQTGDIANSTGYILSYRQTYSEEGLKQSKLWKNGTLCITIAANIAKTSILTFNACFPDSVVGFTPNEETNVHYIQQWFSFVQRNLEETAPESAQKNINLEILRGLDVICPPLPLQEKFAEIVQKFERIRRQQREATRQAEHLFQTLLHRAFRGEL